MGQSPVSGVGTDEPFDDDLYFTCGNDDSVCDGFDTDDGVVVTVVCMSTFLGDDCLDNDDVEDDNSFNEFDDKPFDHDDGNRLLLAKAFWSWCVGLVVVNDVVDDGCADP